MGAFLADANKPDTAAQSVAIMCALPQECFYNQQATHGRGL